MPKMHPWILALGACALLAVAGCGKDDPVDPIDPVLLIPDPPTLMDRFRSAYRNMDYDGYLAVIDPSFKIYLNQQTIDNFTLFHDYFNYDEDARITRNMFSGDAITRPSGDLVPGIVGIDFAYFQAEDDWSESGPDDKIPDALWAPYRVDIVVHQGSHDLRIQGRIDFYVRAFAVGGTTEYRMVGQVDGTGTAPAKPIEDGSWGTVKALYR